MALQLIDDIAYETHAAKVIARGKTAKSNRRAGGSTCPEKKWRRLGGSSKPENNFDLDGRGR
jgi:hypothetical protein